MLTILSLTVLGYLLGAIPFSYLIGKLFAHKDIRNVGDGNPGETNVIKAGGVLAGLVAILLDIGKGFLSVYLAGLQGINSGWGMIPIVLAPILGHATQPFLRSRGGKALGTAGGAWAGVIGLWVFWDFTFMALVALIFIKDHAWASILGSLSLILWAVFLDGSAWVPAMRPFTSTLPFDEALRRLEAAAAPVDRVVRVRLNQAAGLVLARDMIADHDVPGFDRAAMDGYAVVSADTTAASAASPVALRKAGVAYTGDAPGQALVRGTCVEIATGAPLPPGADAVVMVEQTELDAAGRVLVRTPVEHGHNVSPRGADIRACDVVLRSGDELTPGRLGAVAAIGLAEIVR